MESQTQKLHVDFKNLESLLADAKADLNGLTHKGNATAGTRLRQAMQNIKVLAQQIRATTQEVKKTKKPVAK